MSAEMAARRASLAMQTDESYAQRGNQKLTMRLSHGKTQGEADGS
jgi:hypothetical protein